MISTEISEHSIKTDSHTSFYLACGPEDGPLMIFVHGWPELSLSWRHQLPAFAALGFRCIAPDMRGYGRSSIYPEYADYTQELIVADMLSLLKTLNHEKAIWVGHDWGSAVVWNIAGHHPERCVAIVSLCVPYMPGGLVLETAIELVDRNIYPEDVYPAGQWEYMRFYEENFDKATADWERDIHRSMKIMFRKGDPSGMGKVAGTAMTRINGGWFGSSPETPDLPIDKDIISEEDLKIYVEGLERNGFFGPGSWYMNHAANCEYGQRALNNGVLEMPVLFIGGMYDYTCETINSQAKEPMQKLCKNISFDVIKSGHWMAQEKPLEVNATIAKWMATQVAGYWPVNK
ncbi:MAG: pimeloyl-ACP methyl ester carboxylesterase [Gammaproteobacteria bacterium]|jgi:pimeloyl-ACP methyl ester carboxylesterase